MWLTIFLPLLFFSSALAVANPYADFPATTTYRIPPSLSAAFDSAWNSAYSSWMATKLASPENLSAYNAWIEYSKTRKDMPEIVTATDAVTSYTSMPYWYKALPTDTKSYYDEYQKAAGELRARVVKEITGDAARRPVDRGVYVSGTIAGLVAVAAIAL